MLPSSSRAPSAATPRGRAVRCADRVETGEVALDLSDQRLHLRGAYRLLHGWMLERAAHPALTARSLGNLCFRCYNPGVEIRLLGPLEVRDGGVTFALPRRQQRALLA